MGSRIQVSQDEWIELIRRTMVYITSGVQHLKSEAADANLSTSSHYGKKASNKVVGMSLLRAHSSENM
jgi:hypothetical protein